MAKQKSAYEQVMASLGGKSSSSKNSSAYDQVMAGLKNNKGKAIVTEAEPEQEEELGYGFPSAAEMREQARRTLFQLGGPDRDMFDGALQTQTDPWTGWAGQERNALEAGGADTVLDTISGKRDPGAGAVQKQMQQDRDMEQIRDMGMSMLKDWAKNQASRNEEQAYIDQAFGQKAWLPQDNRTQAERIIDSFGDRSLQPRKVTASERMSSYQRPGILNTNMQTGTPEAPIIRQPSTDPAASAAMRRQSDWARRDINMEQMEADRLYEEDNAAWNQRTRQYEDLKKRKEDAYAAYMSATDPMTESRSLQEWQSLEEQMRTMEDQERQRARNGQSGQPVRQEFQMDNSRISSSFLQDLQSNSAIPAAQRDYLMSYVLLDEEFQWTLSEQELANLRESARDELETAKAEYQEAYNRARSITDTKTSLGGMIGGAIAGSTSSDAEWQAAQAEANAAKNRMQMLEAGLAQMDNSQRMIRRNSDITEAESVKKNADFEEQAAAGMDAGSMSYDQIQDSYIALGNPMEAEGDLYADAQLPEGAIQNKVEWYIANKPQRESRDPDYLPYIGEEESYIQEGDKKLYQYLTEDERKVYAYLLQTRGETAADKYIDDKQVALSKRKVQEQQQTITNAYNNAVKGDGARAWLEGEAIRLGMQGMAVLGGTYGGAAKLAGDALSAVTGEYNPYNGWGGASRYSQTVENATADRIDRGIRNIMGEGWATDLMSNLTQYGYRGLKSGLQSSLGAVTLGQLGLDTTGMTGAQKFLAQTFANGYTLTMSAGAAADAWQEMYESGASAAQTALTMISAGVFEALFEELSLDKFYSEFLSEAVTGNGMERAAKYIKKILLQGGIEGSEELATDLANMSADAIINGAANKYQQAINQMVLDGESWDSARGKQLKEQIIQELLTFYSSAISGGAMGASGVAANEAVFKEQNRQTGRNIRGVEGGAEALRTAAQNNGVNSKLMELALQKSESYSNSRFGAIADAAGKSYDYLLGKLSDRTREAIINKSETVEQDSFQQTAEQKLRENKNLAQLLGETDEKAAADVLTKAAYSTNSLTPEEADLYDKLGGKKAIQEIQESQEFRDNVQDNQRAIIQEYAEQTANAKGETNNLQTTQNIAAQEQEIQDWAQQYDEPGVAVENWQRGQNAVQYTQAWENAYEMGQQGVAKEYAMLADNVQYLTKKQIAAAYEEGAKHYEEGSEGVPVRQGEQWNDSAYTPGQVRQVETGAAARQGAEAGQQQAGSGTAEADRVSAREIGIANGTEERNLIVRQPEEYNADEKAAQRVARKHGLNLVVVRGGQIRTTVTVNGGQHTVKARGAVIGNTMYVRSDHNQFTAEQIAKHEAAHKQIESGEVSRDEVRQKLKEKYTEDQINEIVRLYANAYGSNSGMTAEDIFEEILCDAQAGMNAFATSGFERSTAEVGVFLRNVSRAEEQTRKPGAQAKADQSADSAMLSSEFEGMDEEYLELAKDPEKNKARLQEMVDSKAKQSGLDVENLYHGTDSFGFTQIDVSRSDDEISFFVSDEIDVSASYITGNEEGNRYANVKEIGRKTEQKKKLEQSDSVNDVLERVRYTSDQYRRAYAADGKEKLKYAEKYMDKAIDAAKKLLNYVIPENIEVVCDMLTVAEKDRVMDWRDAWTLYEEARDIHSPDIYHNGQYFYEASMLWQEVKKGLRDVIHTIDGEYVVLRGGELVSKSSIVDDYNKRIDSGNKGIYKLYADNRNQLVINGKHNSWNAVPLTGKISADIGETASTREVAEWAKRNGYGSVRIYNVYDSGAFSYENKESTVTAYFDPSHQLKSADPVTYDDAGNVIPLSERFNTAKKDIRYSREIEDAIAERKEDDVRTEAEQEDGFYTEHGSTQMIAMPEKEVQLSTEFNEEFMDKARAKNNAKRNGTHKVQEDVLEAAAMIRHDIAETLRRLQKEGKVGLPADVMGNTWMSDSSYGGTEENTTICPRTLVNEAFVDAVSELLGRPLTVEEQVFISQQLQDISSSPECLYCYVATDRKAYREFLGEYVKQRDAVLEKLKQGGWDTTAYTAEEMAKLTDEQKKKSLYNEFLEGRKNTNEMAKRFLMWVDIYENGGKLMQPMHLTNMQKLMGDIGQTFGMEYRDQIIDAMAYAQSASWAKKRRGYVAYNGHILKWNNRMINKLNSHYGMRMYSFSDFHPAFTLENMQMITDAAVKGLKVLSYTKDMDFARIFAPTKMNINISVFGQQTEDGHIIPNEMIGAPWEEAQALRQKYKNVGCTFVATNDALVDWALKQDWIDVVIPYHLVRTGAEVARKLGYTNYTSESGDGKAEDFKAFNEGKSKKDIVRSIAPTMHNNDYQQYIEALDKYHLTKRFARFDDRSKYTEEQYMKLVNECRRPASESQAVQPIFDEDAAHDVMAKLEAYGYYTPVGGTVDRMYELADQTAKELAEKAGTKYSREMDSIEDLKRQNYYLKKRVEHWKEQAKLSEQRTANKDDVNSVADRILMEYGSGASKRSIREQLQYIADKIVSGKELDYDSLKYLAKEAARDILEGTYEADPGSIELYDDLRNYFRGRTFRVHNAEQEIGGKKDWADYKKDIRRKYGIRFSETSGTEIDTEWGDLQTYFGNYLFPDEGYGGNDAVWHVIDVLDRMQPKMISNFEKQWTQSVEQISNDVLNELLSEGVRQSGGTAADKIDRRAREQAFQQGRRYAAEEWSAYSDNLVVAETQELREQMARREYELEQRYAEREYDIRRQYELREQERIEREQARDARTERIREAYRTKDEARQINEQERYDRKLADITQTYRNREESREAFAQQRLDRYIAQGRQRETYRILEAKNAETRGKINNLAKRIDAMRKNRGQADTKHVPPTLIKAVAEFCEIFNDDQMRRNVVKSEFYQTRLKNLTESANREGLTEEYLEEAARLARLTDRNERAREKLTALAQEYAKLGEDSVAYDPVTGELIERMRKLFAEKNVLDDQVKSEQRLRDQGRNLEEIYNAMQALVHTVTESNKAFSMGKGKQITDMAEKWRKEMARVNYAAPGWQTAMQRYLMWQMSPDTFFAYTCGFAKGNEGSVIQKAFAQGMQRKLEIERDYYNLFQEFTESKDKKVQKEMHDLMNPDKKNFVEIGLKDRAGREVKLSRGMMLQVAMMLRQEDSRRTLLHNGFRLPNAEIYYKGQYQASYGNAEDAALMSTAIGQEYQELVEQRKELLAKLDALRKDDYDARDEIFRKLEGLKAEAEKYLGERSVELDKMYRKIEGMLTETERKLLEAAAKWYQRSGIMMKDVFLQMYGYAPKLVDNYVPIHRDPDTLVIDIRDGDQANKALNLEHLGFTKERVRSVKPILLTDFFVELEQQKQQIGRYVGFAQVQKDFNKILNVALPNDMTIKKMIGARFGKGKTTLGVSGEEYINHYIADVAGGSSSDNILDRFYGNYMAATLRFNPRVAVSQAASIPTAAAVVGWDNAAYGLLHGIGKAASKNYRNQLAEKNAWFYTRYRGQGASTELSEIAGKGGPIEKIANSKVGKMLFNWCQEVDVFSTGSIMWNMAEGYVMKEGLKQGDAGFDARVQEVYTDILRKSQPNYTTTERSDLLRDKRGGMKMLTMFKTQSNQNLNILLTGTLELQRMRKDFKAGENNVTAEDVKAARKKCADAYTSVIIGGTAIFVLMRTAVNFIMRNIKGYRDKDTGEVEADDLLLAMGKEMVSSLMGITAMGGQVYDFIAPTIFGDTYYGMSDSGISAVSDALESTQKLLAAAVDGDKKVTGSMIEKAVSNLATTMGIPYANAKKAAKAVGAYIEDIRNGVMGTKGGEDGVTRNQYRQRIANALMDGDEAKATDAMAVLWAMAGEDTDEANMKEVRGQYATWLKDYYMSSRYTDTECVKMLQYVGFDKDAAELRVAKWDFMIENPKIDNPSDALVKAYENRGDIPGDIVIDTYRYVQQVTGDKDANGKTISGSKKQKVVDYINGMKLTNSQKRNLFVMMNAGSTKGTPWE